MMGLQIKPIPLDPSKSFVLQTLPNFYFVLAPRTPIIVATFYLLLL